MDLLRGAFSGLVSCELTLNSSGVGNGTGLGGSWYIGRLRQEGGWSQVNERAKGKRQGRTESQGSCHQDIQTRSRSSDLIILRKMGNLLEGCKQNLNNEKRRDR